MSVRPNPPIDRGLDISSAKLSDIIQHAQPLQGGPGLSQKLNQKIERLSDDEQAIVLALYSVGKGEFEPHAFDHALVEAFRRRSQCFAQFISAVPDLAVWLERGQANCSRGAR